MNQNESYHKQLFLEVLEYLEDGIILCDEAFKLTFINNKAAIFLDLQGHCSKDADSILSYVKSNQHTYSKIPGSFPYATLATNAAMMVHTKPLVDSQRKLNGMLLIIKEHTTKDYEGKQVDWNEKKCRYLVEHTYNGILIMNDKSSILEANKNACTIFGIKKEQFETLQVKDLFPHQSAQESLKIWDKFMQDTIVSGFYKYKHKDGDAYLDFKAHANVLPGLHFAVIKDITQQVLLQKAFKQTESNFKTIFNNSTQAIFIFDEYNKLQSFNQKAQEYFKLYNPLSSLKSNLFHTSNIIPINEQVADEKIARMKEGEVLSDQYSLNAPLTTEVKWFESTLIPFLDSKQKLISYCVTILEITDRKHSEQQLFESEKKFRKLSESSPDIIYIIDVQKRKVTYFNRDTILGYSSKFLEHSEAWLEIVHPEDIKRVKEHWSTFLKVTNNMTDQIEYRLKDKQGRFEWVINRHSILDRDKNGNVSLVLLNITLITEQKVSAEAIKNSEQRLNALVENTNDIIFSVDQDERITFFNSSFKKLLKDYYGMEINMGDYLVDILHIDIISDWKDSIKRALAGKRLRKEVFFTLRNQLRYFDFSFNPIITEVHDVNGVSVMGRDITQRKKDEENIKRTNFELDSFVYKASHDLRAPLRSVLGLVNLAFEEENIKDRKHYLSLVEKSINRLDTFIEDLTNFSRNSRLDLQIEKINFQQIIDDCVENLRFMDQKKPIEIKLDVIHRTDFYSDISRLHIVFQNILSNAIKYRNLRELNSYIHIRVRCGKNQAIISITDNGIGIMQVYLDKIFDMFFRASQHSYGSGLGLYITKQVVEKLGGTINAESVYGEGTTLHIYIPNHYLKTIEK